MALDPSDRGELDRLLAEKQRLEDNIEALTEFLTGPNMPGLSGNLIDEEGFPRADVDLYQVRDARNKIARYQNDHRAVMKEIEKALHDLHSKKCVSVPVEGGRRGFSWAVLGGSFAVVRASRVLRMCMNKDVLSCEGVHQHAPDTSPSVEPPAGERTRPGNLSSLEAPLEQILIRYQHNANEVPGQFPLPVVAF